jgi:hypothetical protein
MSQYFRSLRHFYDAQKYIDLCHFPEIHCWRHIHSMGSTGLSPQLHIESNGFASKVLKCLILNDLEVCNTCRVDNPDSFVEETACCPLFSCMGLGQVEHTMYWQLSGDWILSDIAINGVHWKMAHVLSVCDQVHHDRMIASPQQIYTGLEVWVF